MITLDYIMRLGLKEKLTDEEKNLIKKYIQIKKKNLRIVKNDFWRRRQEVVFACVVLG